MICPRHVDILGQCLANKAGVFKELIDFFGENEASDSIFDLERMWAAVRPDVMAIGLALKMVLHAIESIPFLFFYSTTPCRSRGRAISLRLRVGRLGVSPISWTTYRHASKRISGR